MNSTLYSRLKEVVKYSSLSQNKFAIKADIDKGAISTMLSGSRFGVDKLTKILNAFPEISAEWLLRNQGEMILRDEQNPATTEEIEGMYKELLSEKDEEIQHYRELIKDQAETIKSLASAVTSNTDKPVKKNNRREKKLA